MNKQDKSAGSGKQQAPRTISATELHQRRGAILKDCAIYGTHYIIEKDGFPIAALVPMQDYSTTADETEKQPQ